MNRTLCQRWRSFGAPWLPITLLGLLLCAPLLLTTCPGGHDIYHHLIFSHHFSSQLLQGELYPRWLSDMNGGFGSPTFFFYPPVPYYATTLFAWVPEQGALGHVHEFEIVSTDPHVVFPGNLQGRTIRETGPKGAVIVTVVDAEVTSVERAELDVIRWVRLDVDCTGTADDAVTDLIRAELGRLHGANGSGRPLVARVTLSGEMSDAGVLHDRALTLRDDIRAIAASISAELYVEKVKVMVTEPPRDRVALGEDLGALIDDASTDPGLVAALESDLERFMLAASTALGEAEEGELRLSASQGEWASVLRKASTALRSRLTREG